MAAVETVTKNITDFLNNEKGKVTDNQTIKEKLADMLETSQMTSIIKALNDNDDKSINNLKDIGLDFKSVTDGMKENIGIFKEIAQIESEGRKRAEEIAEKNRYESEATRDKLYETMMKNQQERYETLINDLKNEIKESKENKEESDPISNTMKQISLTLLQDKISELNAPRETPDSVLNNMFAMMDKMNEIKGKLGVNESPKSSDEIELMKLKLQDERIREETRMKVEAENKKADTWKSIAEGLGSEIADALGAFGAAISQKNQINEQQQFAGNVNNNVIPYKCDDCGNLFYLQTHVEDAPCPYCILDKQEQGSD